MNLACYEDFIGIRSACTPTTPKSGLYIEDLPGIDVKRAANMASDLNGVALIEKCIRVACDQTTEDILNYAPEADKPIMFSTKRASYLYTVPKFREDVVLATNEARTIEYEIRRPDLYKFSRIGFKAIVIQSQTTGAIMFTFRENGVVKATANVNTVAGQTIRHEVDITLDGYKASVSANFDGHDVRRLWLPYDNCIPCGRTKGGYTDPQTSLYISGTDSFAVELASDCDLDRAKCFILPYVKYAVLYRAAMNLALEGNLSDRGNFYVFGTNFEEMYKYFEAEYNSRLRAAFPTVKRLLKNQDINCFECAGVKIYPTIV